MMRRHCIFNHRRELATLPCLLAIFSAASASSGTQEKLIWQEDVSHVKIPQFGAKGMVGSKSFTVTRALIHDLVFAGSAKASGYKLWKLELTAKDGTPGAEFDIAVAPGTKLDRKVVWQSGMNKHSAAVESGSGDRKVSYPPFQAIWLHGERDKNFTLMSVFKMLGVTHYSVRIEFGHTVGMILPGKIYFCGQADDFWKAPKSVIEGQFFAKILPSGK